MVYTNLPGVFPEKQDGGLAILATSNAPKVLVMGTATSGYSETPYLVGRTQEAAVLFGTGGTLIRGMYETKASGAENVILFRMGATATIIEGIGVMLTTGGIRIETAAKDNSTLADYDMYFDETSAAQRLVIRNVASGATVFDRDYTLTTATIDRGEVYVSGSPTDGEGDAIGTPSALVTFTYVNTNKVALSVSVTPGTDGTAPSRMKLYEFLYTSYKQLENVDFDIVVPVDTYLDDLNVVNLTSAQVTTLGLAAISDYPTTSSATDYLGKVFVEEYQGEYYFWWWMPSDPEVTDATALETLFVTTDSGANISPSVGSASALLKIDGTTALTAADFHEVNFAYQLADFCYTNSTNNTECIGTIGVLPPVSVSLKDVSNWVGKLPTYSTDADGDVTISGSAYNGTGLLGNKFMAGKYGFRANVGYGGFIATDDNWLDGTEETDRGGHVIDIGKYISVVGGWVTLFNSFDSSGLGYISTGAPSYAGTISTLAPKNAPTNKLVNSVSLPYRLNNTKLDNLAGLRYVFFQEKPKGTVIADAPTAARPDSDYRRLSTMRIVKEVVDAIRSVSDPFVGNAGGAPQRAALQTACEGALAKLKKAGSLSRYDLRITATPAQQVAGDATMELELVPAYELRQITLILSLAAI